MQAFSMNDPRRDELGRALLDAVDMGNQKLCTELLSQGADVNWKTKEESPALHTAALRGNVELMRLLIAAGANIDATGLRGERALTLAMSSHASFEATKLLLDEGADPNFCTDVGNRPLSGACGLDDAALTTLLVQHGADPNYVGNRDLTVFQSNVYWNKPVSVRLLAQLSVVDMEQVTSDGQTLLDLAEGNDEMTTLLRSIKSESAVENGVGSAVVPGAAPARARASMPSL